VSTGTGPGWYPDPTGRFDVRYYNGRTWTGDVATGGARFVDTVPLTPPTVPAPPPGPRQKNGLATASMVCGIVAVATGWLPVVFVAGAVLAVLAVIFGAVGLSRARKTGVGRAFATTGLITGAIGFATAAIGVWFTVYTFREFERYDEPAANEAVIEECTGDGLLSVSGTLTNLDDETADFTVFVAVERASSGVEVDSFHVPVDDVDAGDTVEFAAVRRVGGSAELDCRIDRVMGPLPFGIVPD